MRRFLAVLAALVLAANLLWLWPSVAGRLLFALALLLVFIYGWPRKKSSSLDEPRAAGAQGAMQTAPDQSAAAKVAEAQAEAAAETAVPHDQPTGESQLQGLAMPILIGMTIGLGVICFIEVYLSVCSIFIGLPLGDRAPGQYLLGESSLFKLLMIARQLKNPIAHYSHFVILGLIIIVLLGSRIPRWSKHGIADRGVRWVEGIANVLVGAAAATVTAGFFSFWPLVDGNVTNLTKVVATVTLSEEFQYTNDQYFGATKRQNKIGSRLIKLLKPDNDGTPAEKHEADQFQEMIDKIYDAIASGQAIAFSKLDATRAKEVIDDMKRGLLLSPARPKPAPAACGGDSYVCVKDVSGLADANKALAREQERVAGSQQAALKLNADVEFPLAVAIQTYLETKHGSNVDEDVARLTIAIVMAIAAGADDDTLVQMLTAAGTRAAERSSAAQAEVASLVCADLQRTLVQYLQSPRGLSLYTEKIATDPDGFARQHPTETGLGLSVSQDPPMRRVNDFLAQQFSEGSELRNALRGLLPDGVPTRMRTRAADLAANILRAACYQEVTPGQLTDLLNRLATPT
jgi:hypothetical protein